MSRFMPSSAIRPESCIRSTFERHGSTSLKSVRASGGWRPVPIPKVRSNDGHDVFQRVGDARAGLTPGLYIKKLVTEMHFDEARADDAEFEKSFIGKLAMLSDLVPLSMVRRRYHRLGISGRNSRREPSAV